MYLDRDDAICEILRDTEAHPGSERKATVVERNRSGGFSVSSSD